MGQGLVQLAEVGGGAEVVLFALLTDVQSLLHRGLRQPAAHDSHGTAGVIVEGAVQAHAGQLRVQGVSLQALGAEALQLA